MKIVNKNKIVLLLIMAFSFSLNINASNVECEITESYLKWNKLSENEKAGTVMPIMCEQYPSASTVLKGVTFPNKYKSISTPVRNQGNVGSCWAFSTSTALESYVLKHFNKTYQFSTRHMDYMSSRLSFLDGKTNPIGYNRLAGLGGNDYYASNYFINQYGPILESYFPFENNSNNIELSSLYGYPTQIDVNDIQMYRSSIPGNSCSTSDINEMKNSIYNYGPIVVGLYMNTIDEFYNWDTNSMYINNYYGSNHSVAVVGWDDDYSVDNFSTKPSRPGAWIIQNSYGTYFGDKGYFYVSYDDYNVCEEFLSIKEADLTVEDHLYSLDEMGYSASSGELNSNNKYAGYAMNIFTKESENEEYIREVTFAATSKGIYKVYLYNGNMKNDNKGISDMTLLGSGNIEHAGYTTFKLNDPISIGSGIRDFSVAVYYESSEKGKQPIGISIWDGQSVNNNVSFFSPDGENWSDYASNNNYKYEASIKVSTDDVDSLSTLFKITSKEIKYEAPLKVVFNLKTRGVSNLNISIKDSNNTIINPAYIEYNYLNDDYTKATIYFNDLLLNDNYTFTFTYNNSLSKEEVLTLNADNITDIRFKDDKIVIQSNSCISLPEIIFTPSENVIKNINWSTKNNNISISNNQLCVGTYSQEDDELTATTINGISKTIMIDIIYDYQTISNYPNYFDVEVGDEILITDRNYDDRLFSRAICFNSKYSADCTIYWDEMTITSSDSSILSDIGNKKFKALKPGTATISIISKNNKKSIITVHSQISYTGISLNKDKIDLDVGNSEKLIVETQPNNSTMPEDFTWTSSSPNVATVSTDGTVSAIGVGTTTISVSTFNGYSDSVIVTVKSPITLITLDKTNLSIIKGEKYTLISTITPINTTDSKNITWTSSNENIAKVDSNGTVTAITEGIVTIIAKTINGKTSSCSVEVKSDHIDIDNISISSNELSIEKYKSDTLSVNIYPSDTTLSNKIEWFSSNSNIVSVDTNGKITAKSIGKANITAKSVNGKTASCSITVTKVKSSSVNVSSISNKTYTGRQIKPSIKLTYEGRTLKYKTDYTLKYGTNKYTGKGSIKITFKGSNYYGSKTVYFYIIPKKTTIRTAKSYSKSTVSVYYYRVTGASGYQIAYRKYETTEWKYTNTKYTSKKITSLARKKQYEVRVRAYKIVNGKKYYGSWSSKKIVKIK